MKATWNQAYESRKEQILHCIENFNSTGKVLYEGRNMIKTFELDDIRINIKSFRIPNLVNKLAYRFFRKSKAERSFAYASILKEKGIGTPDPVAYFEEESAFTFKRSFYVSRQVDYDLTFRELVSEPDFPQHEEILRAFTRFTYSLHENDILFLDHSPGNTLIQINNGEYRFYLVDLNRMMFKKLTDTERFLNFSRLTPKREMVEVMADEYARLMGRSPSEVFAKMWFFTDRFQKKYWKKQKLKRFVKPKKD